jgi:hypothetical protein
VLANKSFFLLIFVLSFFYFFSLFDFNSLRPVLCQTSIGAKVTVGMCSLARAREALRYRGSRAGEFFGCVLCSLLLRDDSLRSGKLAGVVGSGF